MYYKFKYSILVGIVYINQSNIVIMCYFLKIYIVIFLILVVGEKIKKGLCRLRWFKLNLSKCQKDVKCQIVKHLDYGGGSQKKAN